jgi:hypothetical protein
MVVQLTVAELEAIIDRRHAAFVEELTAPATAPALVDRAGLARALSCSVKTVDRLRAEANFPEQHLYELPRFDVADVVAWIKARNRQGLRLVEGGGQ